MVFDCIEEESLFKLSSSILFNTLSFYGLKVDMESQNSLNDLLYHYTLGIGGKLTPSFFLSSLDPGVGKTETISSFIKAWKSLSFKPNGSILIGVSSKDQIDSLIKRLGIDETDYAVFTGDSRFHTCGVGIDSRREAPILITTQQMIISRTKDRRFSNASDFFFGDSPRTLRIWDESFVLSQQISIAVSSLHSLGDAMKAYDRNFAEELVKFASEMKLAAVGQVFKVSPYIRDRADTLLKEIRSAKTFCKTHPLTGKTTILESLSLVGSRSLRLGNYGGVSDLTLIGASKPLPDDFAPAIILDASGRVRGTYALWEAAGGNLVRLQPKANNYANLMVRFWQRASGKWALKDEWTNREILSAVAEAIATKPDEEWLIIGDKGDADFSVFELLKATVPPETVDKLHYVHWGRHMATNAYSHVRNAVVIGAFSYGNAGYDALAAAALGDLPDPRIADDESRSLVISEYQHNLLQGLMRSHARNAKDGVCGECTAYVVASKPITEDVILRTFPGCTVDTWREPPPRLSATAAKLIDYVATFFARDETKLRKSDAVKAIGMHPKSLSKILTDPTVKDGFKENGITWTTRFFKPSP